MNKPDRAAKAAPLMDWAVVVSMSLVLIHALTLLVIGVRARAWLERHFTLLAIWAVANCAVLLTWMLGGGAKSVLWRWLPPFCMFPDVKWLRWVVVVAVVSGTVMGGWGIYTSMHR
jgi:hypothetical protein